MTHAELVARAHQWLCKTIGSPFAFAELVATTTTGEIPDGIGWVHSKSIVVECKRTVADFRADQKKPGRNNTRAALGNWRFYLTEAGVLEGCQLPEGWGLYELRPSGGRLKVYHTRCVKYRNATQAPCASCQSSEIALLKSALRRFLAPLAPSK